MLVFRQQYPSHTAARYMNVTIKAIATKIKSDFIVVTLGRITIIAAQILFVKLYTHYYSASQLGVYFFWQTISYSFSAIIFVPLDLFQQAKLHTYVTQNNTLLSFLNVNTFIIKWLCILFFIISVSAYLITNKWYVGPLLSAVMAISIYLSQTLRNTCNNLDYRVIATVFGALDSILRFVLLFLYVKIFTPDPLGIIVTTSGAGIIVAIFLSIIFHYKKIWGDGPAVSPKLSEMVTFIWPISISAVMNWLQIQGCRFLVPFGYSEVVGIYATVASVGSAGMLSLSSIMQMIFLPSVYKTRGNYTNTYLIISLSSILFVIAVSIPLATVIVRLITNVHFVSYAYCIMFGILIEGGNLLLGGMGVYLQIHNATKYILYISIIGFFVSAIFLSGLLFMKLITPYTIGLANVTAQVVAVIALYLYYRLSVARK